MRQISSKLNMYVRSVGVVNNNIEKFIFNIIFGFFGILALLYILFLGNMVKNIIERRSLEANAHTLSNEVRDLEVAYLSMSNDIDLTFSHSLGFQEPKKTFITRKVLGLGFQESFESVKITQNDL